MIEKQSNPILDAVNSAEVVSSSSDENPVVVVGWTEDEVLNLNCALLEHSDLGNAYRLLKRFGNDYLSVEEIGYLAWNGKNWSKEGAQARLELAAQAVTKEIANEADALRRLQCWLNQQSWFDGEKYPAVDPKIEERRGVAVHASDALARWGTIAQAGHHVSNIVKLARPHLIAAVGDFDRDPMVFNVSNGTLRFAKVDGPYTTLNPHNRDDRITKLSPVKYDPQALCPLYEAFLARVQPDEAMRVFLHTFGGLALTGLPHPVMQFWYGKGRNGKGVTANIWGYVAGEYSMTIPVESFLDQGRARRGSDATPDFASLPSIRMLRTSEPEKRSRLSESTIKLATGGEPMRTRHLNKNFFEFRPVFKLVMQGNYRPFITGTDEGLWSRIQIVPWPVTIPTRERDPHLFDKLKAEASGILNRLIDGICIYLDRDLEQPETVLRATADYRRDSDQIQSFLDECTELGDLKTHSAQAQPLYDLYSSWCQAKGENIWKQKTFKQGLHDHGIEQKRSSVYIYCGVKMIKAPSDFVD